MEPKELEFLYKNLLTDNDFERIELYTREPNIFAALGLEQYEIRHSNFLAWLLNPRGNHNMGELFLVKILRDILMDNRSGAVSIIDVPSLNLREAVIRREWKNIDILIELSNLIIVIENKTYSGEHSDQLNRYRQRIEEYFPDHQKVYVFLSPFGNEASDKVNYINYSYKEIIDILQKFLSIYSKSVHPSVIVYLKDYIQAVKYTIMQDSPINELARKIYINHRELFDIIIENRPDEATEFRKYLVDKVSASGWVLGSDNKGYVRFLTKELAELIPKGYSYGWPDKEAFLFEINFFWSKGKIRFYCTVSPGDAESKAILSNILENMEGSKKASGQKWQAYLGGTVNFSLDEMMEKDDDEKRKFINSFWPKVEAMVSKVEKALLANRYLLEELNNRRGIIKK